MNVGCFDLFKICVQHLSHRRAGNIRTLLRQTAVGKIAACVLGVCHINIRNDIDYASVSLLGKALILTAVARLHMKYRNMQALCTDNRKA